MLTSRCSLCLRAAKPVSPSSWLRGHAKVVMVPTASFWRSAVGDEFLSEKQKAKQQYRDAIKYGVQEMKDLPGEFGKYAQELKGKFVDDPKLFVAHNAYDTLYRFDSDDAVKDWVLSTDADMGVGRSHAEFILGQNKTGIFRGFLDTEPVKDGIMKNAGYCNIRSPTKKISFKRPVAHDLSLYSHLLVRCRGDGRPYQVMMSMERYFDIQWADQYSYTLFTRGGPYWQWAKIPFSKFFLTSKGRIQDMQERIQLEKVTTLGLTAADGCTGRFQLEVDFVAVLADHTHVEEFAYEMYEAGGSCMV